MTITEILQIKMSLGEAKLAVYRENSSCERAGEIEINQVFYPALASAVVNQGMTAIDVIKKYFLPFDHYSQAREAKILNEYLIQLGSK